MAYLIFHHSDRLDFPNQNVIQSLKIALILANIEDSDEIPHGSKCLPKSSFHVCSTVKPVNGHSQKYQICFSRPIIARLLQGEHSAILSTFIKLFFLFLNGRLRHVLLYTNVLILKRRERSGSVVECLTQDRGAAGSSLTGVTALWSLSKTHLS